MNLTIFCFQNFTLRSTPLQYGPASSLSAVNEDLVSIKVSSLFRGETDIVQHCLNRFFEEISFFVQNDSSAQVPASGTLPTFLPMMTSTPNMVFTNLYSCYQTIISLFIATHYSYYINLKNIPTSLTGRFPTHWLK